MPMTRRMPRVLRVDSRGSTVRASAVAGDGDLARGGNLKVALARYL